MGWQGRARWCRVLVVKILLSPCPSTTFRGASQPASFAAGLGGGVWRKKNGAKQRHDDEKTKNKDLVTQQNNKAAHPRPWGAGFFSIISVPIYLRSSKARRALSTSARTLLWLSPCPISPPSSIAAVSSSRSIAHLARRTCYEVDPSGRPSKPQNGENHRIPAVV